MDLVKTTELVNALGWSKKTVLEKARKYGWSNVVKGNAILFIETQLPTDVRFALSSYRITKTPVLANSELPTIKSEISDNNTLLMASDKAQETAQYRAAVIYEFKKSGTKIYEFLEAYNEHNAFPLLYKELGFISQPTFYRWIASWKKQGAEGVIPKYGMGKGGAGASLSDEERDLLRHFWLKSTQPSVAHAYRLLKENIPYSKCSYETALRYLQSIPKPTAGLYRLGAGRFENLFLPHMEQNLSRYKSLEVVVSDHHCLDCVVLYDGELIRPWLTTFQDLRSGKVLGWCPCVKPSSLSIVVAYYMCCIRYGVPESLLFDNGKDYRSKFLNGYSQTVKVESPEKFTEEVEIKFQGVFNLLGSDVRFTRTYNGKSKARQERYFRIIGEYFSRELGTYVGSDSRSRPEEADLMWRAINKKEQRHDIPTWDNFVNDLDVSIEYINDSFVCTGSGMDGKTRSAVYEENLPEVIRTADKTLMQKALTKGQIRKVGRNGVKVGSINFYHPALFEFQGTQIKVHESLLTDKEVMCCTLSDQYICNAVGNYFKETGELSADIERLESARKGLTKLAELGSGEVKTSPELENMNAVAKRTNGEREITDVDKCLNIQKIESNNDKFSKEVN